MDREKRIREIGAVLYSFLQEERPTFFGEGGWKGKVIEWSLRDEQFKIQLLRFLDVLPALKRDEAVLRVFREYLEAAASAPSILRQGAETFAQAMPARIAAPVIRASVRSLARQFIAGTDPQDALPFLEALSGEGAALSVDLLGESVVSEEEAQTYARRYLGLLDFLAPRFMTATQPHRSRIDISLKVSSFYSQMEPLNFEGSIVSTTTALGPVLAKARELGASVTFDMEQYYFKDLVIAIFKNIVAGSADLPPMGIALQAYLRDTRDDLTRLVQWAKEHRRHITIRLVKGAYWDYETVVNAQKGWPIPVFLRKEETDRNFEYLTGILLENAEFVYPAIATHNMRSITNALAQAEGQRLVPEQFEFQTLYGMGDPLRRALKRMSVPYPMKVYCPVGELIPGMAYLVRRVLENTANESFFRRTFAEKASFEELMRVPVGPEKIQDEGGQNFRNEPATDFSKEDNRRQMREALRTVKNEFGRTYAILIGENEVYTGRETLSINPARPHEIIGRISSASRGLAEKAVYEAERARGTWSLLAPQKRADHLFRAAEEMRKRRFTLTALEVCEVGKTIMEADADVAEAIDYLEYYGRQMIELGKPQRLGRYPGEANEYAYEPKGIGVVISPWNFPLAIPTGMSSAAIVAGNCMILKPSGLAPVLAWQLVDIFRAAGLPPGVLQFLPGSGAEVGEHLVCHPAIDVIAFTGSKDVGLRIIRLSGETAPGQRNVKKVVAEMGGKNAIIVDETADLDEAVKGVIESAFGYQGQKCSACSRVIIQRDAYEEFCGRLKGAMKSFVIGPPDEASTFMGPLIDNVARAKVRAYLEAGKKEGTPLFLREAGGEGFYAGPALFEVNADASIAQEEIFGPVVAVLKAENIGEAIAIANHSEYALTGGLFSRSPANIEMVKRSLQAGNVYINRKITGALVGRQPFGGVGMSGNGSKAGGPGYLLQFMNPKTISENTLRKGVAQPGSE